MQHLLLLMNNYLHGDNLLFAKSLSVRAVLPVESLFSTGRYVLNSKHSSLASYKANVFVLFMTIMTLLLITVISDQRPLTD